MNLPGISLTLATVNLSAGTHNKRFHHWPALLLFLVYILVQSYAIRQLTITYDEESFLQYGITLLKGEANKDIRKFESKLPITTLNALPRAIEQIVHPTLKKSGPLEDIIAGRFISLLASLVLGIIIYCWTSQWYGYGAGICSLIFYLLCPNFLAHGILVSSDIFACLFLALTVYFFSRWRETGKKLHFLLFTLCFSLGQLSKFSMVHMLFVIIIISGILWFSNKNRGPVFTKNNLVLAVIFLLINWLVISGGHLFYDIFFPLNKYEYHSSVFRTITGIAGRFATFIYIPLPSSYIRSMDMVMYFDQLGGGVPGAINGEPYILSRYNTHGFWYYYLVSFFYKVPIPFMVILMISFAIYLKKTNRQSFLRREIYLFVPVLYYLVYMSSFYSTQVGIRHFLIIFPLLFVFAGFLFQKILVRRFTLIIIMAIASEILSVSSYFPHFLPYTNEFIQDKKNAWKKIADTNLCYREGGHYLRAYLDLHKNAVYTPARPVSGLVVVEVNDYLGLQENSRDGQYDWLRGLEPVDHIHSQYLIFDVPEK